MRSRLTGSARRAVTTPSNSLVPPSRSVWRVKDETIAQAVGAVTSATSVHPYLVAITPGTLILTAASTAMSCRMAMDSAISQRDINRSHTDRTTATLQAMAPDRSRMGEVHDMTKKLLARVKADGDEATIVRCGTLMQRVSALTTAKGMRWTPALSILSGTPVAYGHAARSAIEQTRKGNLPDAMKQKIEAKKAAMKEREAKKKKGEDVEEVVSDDKKSEKPKDASDPHVPPEGLLLEDGTYIPYGGAFRLTEKQAELLLAAADDPTNHAKGHAAVVALSQSSLSPRLPMKIMIPMLFGGAVLQMGNGWASRTTAIPDVAAKQAESAASHKTGEVVGEKLVTSAGGVGGTGESAAVMKAGSPIPEGGQDAHDHPTVSAKAANADAATPTASGSPSAATATADKAADAHGAADATPSFPDAFPEGLWPIYGDIYGNVAHPLLGLGIGTLAGTCAWLIAKAKPRVVPANARQRLSYLHLPLAAAVFSYVGVSIGVMAAGMLSYVVGHGIAASVASKYATTADYDVAFGATADRTIVVARQIDALLRREEETLRAEIDALSALLERTSAATEAAVAAANSARSGDEKGRAAAVAAAARLRAGEIKPQPASAARADDLCKMVSDTSDNEPKMSVHGRGFAVSKFEKEKEKEKEEKEKKKAAEMKEDEKEDGKAVDSAVESSSAREGTGEEAKGRGGESRSADADARTSDAAAAESEGGSGEVSGETSVPHAKKPDAAQ